MASDARFFAGRKGPTATPNKSTREHELEQQIERLRTEVQQYKNALKQSEAERTASHDCKVQEYVITKTTESLRNCSSCNRVDVAFLCSELYYLAGNRTHEQKTVTVPPFFLCEPCRIARFELTPCVYHHTVDRIPVTAVFRERTETVTFLSRTKNARK